MDIRELAALMGRPVAEVATFVACLDVFTRKGQSLDQAMQSAGAAWADLLNNVSDGYSNEHSRHFVGARALAADLAAQMWDAVNVAGVA
jgi:hypothetical protein